MGITKDKAEAFRLTALLAGSTFLLKGLTFPLNIIYANILGPTLLGALKIFDLISTYAGYSHLGTFQTLSRQMTIALGREDAAEAKQIQDVVFTLNLLLTAVFVGVLWVLWELGVDFDEVLTLPRLCILTGILIASRVDNYLHACLKAVGDFSLVTRRTIIVDWVTPFMLLAFVYFWKLEGALVATLSVNLLGIAVYLTGHRVQLPRWHLAWGTVRKYLPVGFDLFVNKLADTIFWTIDTTIIAVFLTPTHVGIYGFGLGIVLLATSFTDILNSMIYRQMLDKKGKSRNPGDLGFLESYLGTPLASYLLFNTTLAIFLYFICNLIVNLFLKKYAAVLSVLHILVLGQIFFAASKIPYACLNVGDQLRRRLWVTIGCIILNGVLDVAFIQKAGLGIEGAAWASGISFFVYSSILVIMVMGRVHGSKMRGIVFMTKFIALTLTAYIPLILLKSRFIIDYLPYGATPAGIGAGAIDVLIKAALTLCLPIVGYLWLFKEFRLAQECRTLFRYFFLRARPSSNSMSK